MSADPNPTAKHDAGPALGPDQTSETSENALDNSAIGAPAKAWSDAELAGSPHERDDKAQRVRSMFASIAGSYDMNNRVHSFGRDQAWRRATVKMSGAGPNDRVLDCACGTGDLSRAFLDAGVERVVGLDFTPEMLDIARTKRRSRPGEDDPRIDYVQGDAMALPFEDQSFDIVSIAFGIRNVADPAAAFAEFFRVLRPGGRLVVLEFSEPTNPLLRLGCRLYTNTIMPITATLLSRDRSGAYRYLPKSVSTFLSREAMIDHIDAAGFGASTMKALNFGVCVCYRGTKAGG